MGADAQPHQPHVLAGVSAALATNPLLRSRLAAGKTRGEASPATIQARIQEAAGALRANPRDEKLYRAVRRTYLEPAATQELVAGSLGLPSGTYRTHLAASVQRLTEWRWQRELYGPDG